MTFNCKLIVTDLDGTLLNSNKVVSETNIDALRRVIDAGTPVAIASGRAFAPFALDIAASIGRPVYLILCNGVVILDCDHQTVLSRRGLSPEDIEWLVQLGCAKSGVCWNSWRQELMLLWKRSDGPIVPDMPDEMWVPVNSSDDIISHFSGDVLRGRIFGSDTEVTAVAEEASARGLYVQCYPYPGGGDSCVEMIGQGVSKVSGIEFLCKRLGISMRDVVAFGDESNDVEMLSHVGLGVAMANASGEAKAAADILTCSNDEDGVAEALQRIHPALSGATVVINPSLR